MASIFRLKKWALLARICKASGMELGLEEYHMVAYVSPPYRSAFFSFFPPKFDWQLGPWPCHGIVRTRSNYPATLEMGREVAKW